MAINVLRRNPTIDTFQSGMQAGDAARRAEAEQFRQRLQLEQALGADRALRTGLGSFYADQGAAPAAPTTAAAPGLAEEAAALGIANTPLPVAADQGLAEEAAGLGVPAPAAQPQMPTPTPQGHQAPAQAAAGAAPASRYAPVMRDLSKAPGTGQAMLQLFTRDQADSTSRANTQRQMTTEGSKLMMDALKDGDIHMARSHAQRYGLNVPEEVWRNREVLTNLRTAAGLAKSLGIKDEHAVAFSQGYMEARAAKQPEDQAMLAGLQKVPKSGFEVKGAFTDEKNNVQFYDKSGALKPAGAKARPLASGRAAGGGAGGTATIQNRDDMMKRLRIAYPGIDDALAQKLVINPRATITPQDVIKQRNALQNMKDGLGRPVYKTGQELDNAVKQVLAGAREMAGFAATSSVDAAGRPVPAAAAPAAGGGKRLKFNPGTMELEELPQ